jgi:V-type H+-transporting ATPase subunit d
MDYCTYGHMIDNVVLIVTGTLHERDVQVRARLPPDLSPNIHSSESSHIVLLQELLDKCHPLGMFDSIATLAVASNMRELYRLVLVDTPLAPYFSENLTHEDMDEMNIEIMRNTLYKAYLDDFATFCHSLGGATGEVMGDLLAFEVGPMGSACVDGWVLSCWLLSPCAHAM